jgi:hypothetical protein
MNAVVAIAIPAVIDGTGIPVGVEEEVEEIEEIGEIADDRALVLPHAIAAQIPTNHLQTDGDTVQELHHEGARLYPADAMTFRPLDVETAPLLLADDAGVQFLPNALHRHLPDAILLLRLLVDEEILPPQSLMEVTEVQPLLCVHCRVT